MTIEEFKSMGWSDMHPMQVEAVMNMISSAIGLAECTKTQRSWKQLLKKQTS